jgi:hypothetical protein
MGSSAPDKNGAGRPSDVNDAFESDDYLEIIKGPLLSSSRPFIFHSSTFTILTSTSYN